MDIRCPSCSKLFRVADEKIAGKGIRFKCSKCAEIITITKDNFEMDLLAREAEASQPIPQQPRGPALKPSPPTPPEPFKPSPQQPILTPEPEAREYQPSQEQDIPPAALNDFDFSEPHAAAMAAANPEEGFGGQDFSFTGNPEQDALPEVEISLEAAAEAEAALQFPDDLISEPARKPAFVIPSASEPAADDKPLPASKPEVKDKPVFAQPSIPKAVPELQTDADIDLGAALAMPKGPTAGAELTEKDKDAVFSSPPPVQKGPVITPELLAQMQRNALKSPAAKAKAASHDDEDLDLGAALAMPKTGKPAGQGKTSHDSNTSAVPRGAGSTLSGKAPLIIAAVAMVLVAALAGLYFTGHMDLLLGWKGQTMQQPASQPKAQMSRPVITPEGLSIVDPVAFVDPERGDLVITGKIQNTTDKPKHGWYLVAEVRDAKETVLTTVRMLNGTQLYSKADQDILVKRGGKLEELQKMMASIGERAISPKGSMPFEVRVMNPPAGSARFLPTLRSLDPAAQDEMKQESTGRK